MWIEALFVIVLLCLMKFLPVLVANWSVQYTAWAVWTLTLLAIANIVKPRKKPHA